MEKKDKPLSVTFFAKQKVMCPICHKEFQKEELLSGGGRLIAGSLTDELRRTYEPSKKYGVIYPLIYTMAACPNCNAAMFWNDFQVFGDDETTKDALFLSEKERKDSVKAIFPYYDFTRNRTLLDGCAAYYLALLCYDKMPRSYSPTIKKAQISLRLAWMCDDMNKEAPGRNYNFIRDAFYQKALFFYQEALNLEMEKGENIMGLSHLGPDIDKNYGYDGVIYISGLLEYKYGQRKDINLRLKRIESAKHSIARVFGLGKTSKEKPGPLLEHSRNLYDSINEELKDAHDVDFDSVEEPSVEDSGLNTEIEGQTDSSVSEISPEVDLSSLADIDFNPTDFDSPDLGDDFDVDFLKNL